MLYDLNIIEELQWQNTEKRNSICKKNKNNNKTKKKSKNKKNKNKNKKNRKNKKNKNKKNRKNKKNKTKKKHKDKSSKIVSLNFIQIISLSLEFPKWSLFQQIARFS
jgi:hypothetical protein